LVPAVAGSGASVFVTERSAAAGGGLATVVDAVDELLARLESAGDELTVAVLVITLPLGVLLATKTPIPNPALGVGASEAMVHVTVPPKPTVGVVQFHPAGEAMAWNVVFAGSTSVRTTFSALSLGSFVTEIM
jgi:hypothetical protein